MKSVMLTLSPLQVAVIACCVGVYIVAIIGLITYRPRARRKPQEFQVEPFSDVLSRPIADLELGKRIENRLSYYTDIRTIGDLVARGERELDRIKYIGKKSLADIKTALMDKFGIVLGQVELK